MLIEKVLAAAQPYLAGKTVRDLVAGVALTACQLDNGAVGVSYVLREQLPAGCGAFPLVRKAVGMPASQVAAWVLTGSDDLLRGVGSAVLAAASQGQSIGDDHAQNETIFGVHLQPSDTVGMIGFIEPLAAQVEKSGCRLLIFDEGYELRGNSEVHTMAEQPRLLPQCSVVILSGTTVINHSIEGLLKLCEQAREIVMVGSSTPMYAEGFAGSGVTRLAGSWWDNSHKEDIFRAISLAGGIGSVHKYMIKKLVKVNG